MSAEFKALVARLNASPGNLYITPDGVCLFALIGPEKKLIVATRPSKNFHEMTKAELNAFIRNFLN